MSPIKQALAVHSSCTSPASTLCSVPSIDPVQAVNDIVEFRTKTELAIKGLQDLLERQGQKLQVVGRLLSKFQRSEIRTLNEDGRKAICKLLKADYETAKQNWASFLQSLSQDEIALLQLSRFTQQAIDATLHGKFQTRGGSTAHSSTPDVIAAAIANLPASAKTAYIMLFDAVYGKGAFDKEEEQAWDDQVSEYG